MGGAGRVLPARAGCSPSSSSPRLPFPRPRSLPQAACLAVCAGKSFEVPQVARLLIQHLDEEYDRLCQGDFATLEACWKWRLGLLGKQVAAECHHGMKYGRLRELSWEGLELETNGGEILRLLPEEVRHLEPA